MKAIHEATKRPPTILRTILGTPGNLFNGVYYVATNEAAANQTYQTIRYNFDWNTVTTVPDTRRNR